ncbi:MAG TPA: hypothetical protein VEX38_08705 [Fimbriimonadaceae bacterium]|nr:hypothetical protein [Fimbriimonadaceae bacterium]
MARLLLIFIASAFLIALSPAQNDFPNNPKNKWVHAAINALKRDGLLPVWVTPATKSVKISQRQKFASVTHGASYFIKYRIDRLHQLSAKPTSDTVEELEALPKDIEKAQTWLVHLDNLEKMSKEFEPELKASKLNAKKLRQDLQATKSKLAKLKAPA